MRYRMRDYRENVWAARAQPVLWVFLLILAIALSSCSGKEEAAAARFTPLPHSLKSAPPGGPLLLNANLQAGDALGTALLPRAGSGSGILVSSMADLDDLDKSSPFGRISMQQIGSRLSQHGFMVLEPRLSAGLRFSKQDGEFMLTRESMRLLADNYDAHAVLVGTYTESRDRVFLSARVVRLQDSAVLAAYEYYLPRNDDVDTLLGHNYRSMQTGREIWSRHAAREQAFPPAPKRP